MGRRGLWERQVKGRGSVVPCLQFIVVWMFLEELTGKSESIGSLSRTRHIGTRIPSTSPLLASLCLPNHILLCVNPHLYVFLSCLTIRIHQMRGKSLWKPGTVVPAPLPSLSSMTLLCFSLVPNSTHPNHSSCPQMSWCPAWQGSPIDPQVTLPKSNIMCQNVVLSNLERSNQYTYWRVGESQGGW